MIWLALGIAGLLFRTVHLFFIRDVQTGLVWMTKILTDPFHDLMALSQGAAAPAARRIDRPDASRHAAQRSRAPDFPAGSGKSVFWRFYGVDTRPHCSRLTISRNPAFAPASRAGCRAGSSLVGLAGRFPPPAVSAPSPVLRPRSARPPPQNLRRL
jgi:hypothetical protein